MQTPPLELTWTVPRPGERIAGKYVVESVCGRGGLSAVLSAVQTGLDRRVALKVLLPEWSGEPGVIERFLREGRAATRIRSEHVVRVFDVDQLPCGAPYLVLEYLEGHDLDDVVAMRGPLPVQTAVDWVLQAAEAIAEAHAHGIVHRDLKPGNLFLTRRFDGSACIKVIDFGLSKLSDPGRYTSNRKITRPTDVMGTPLYMAPEQLRSFCDVDGRTDIWALGAVLHELLTAQPAFGGGTVPEVWATVLTQEPARVSSLRANVPAALEAVVLRCLEKDAASRFGSILEMARPLAPFGTYAARESCERIERMDTRLSGPSLLPPRDPRPFDDPWPSDMEVVRRRFGSPASARVVFAGLGMLMVFGGGVFAWRVHGRPPSGVAPFQATATAAVPTATLAPIPPATPTLAPAPAPTLSRPPRHDFVSAAPSPSPPTFRQSPQVCVEDNPYDDSTNTPPCPPVPSQVPSADPDDLLWLRPHADTSADVPPPAPTSTADDPFAGRK
jgi:serine/threonine protein kinase